MPRAGDQAGTARHPTPSPDATPNLTSSGRQANVSAYAGGPILKRSPWTWMIPTYFFFGGLTGMSATLSLAARLAGRERLADRALLASVLGFLPCPPLLIFDLGRPSRFYNMLRVFRPTSPMSVGTWIFSAFGGALSVAAASRGSGRVPLLGGLASGAAGLLGPALSTYTAVLIANTSSPAWHNARRHLPFLFAAGAAASAGAATAILTETAEAAPARALAIGGAVSETLVSELMARQLGPTGSTYREGAGGNLHWAATACNVVGATLLFSAGRHRRLAAAAGGMILAGACLTRFSVVKAGDASAELT